MNLKNYTSETPIDRSMAKIEKYLVAAGARNIMKDYDIEGNCSAVSFAIPLNGNNIAFKLPARVDSIYRHLYAQYKRPTNKSREVCLAQSGRTAWKIISDWVEIQVTMIQLDQADLMQVFLPYVHNGTQSFYESLKEGGFKLLK